MTISIAAPSGTGRERVSVFSAVLLTIFLFVSPDARGQGADFVDGELREFHNITLTFVGPSLNETSSSNPFLDYRLKATFTHPATGAVIEVPGYFAADGNAAETSATSGNRWRLHFVPDRPGIWNYSVSFRTGSQVAISTSSQPGNATHFDGASGQLDVLATNKVGRDFRARGILRYVGKHHLQFSGSGEYFLKGGANSPENFLAFHEFDGTTDTHRYAPHVADYNALGGGPTWQGGKGKGILGALNYLASKGMNSVYFLTMNVGGDGDDVWPWISETETLRYDVSKLAQWERVFSHMDELGLMLHIVTQETENDQLLDGGSLGVERKLYYRELIARFGHHLAITWNLGEENSNTSQQVESFDDYFQDMDPYGHHVVVHTFPTQISTVYDAQLDNGSLTGASLQVANLFYVNDRTKEWIDESADHGLPWVVAMDELGPPTHGVVPDANNFNHDDVRQEVLWANLIAGGGGCEWYFGYSFPNDDLDCEDWRSRDHMWELTDHALGFFRDHVRFWEMSHDDGLVTGSQNFCLANPGESYVVYFEEGVSNDTLDLESNSHTYTLHWFDPRNGGNLRLGSVTEITGPGKENLGSPPSQSSQDWALLVRRKDNRNPVMVRSEISPTPLLQPHEMTIRVFGDDPDGLGDLAPSALGFLWTATGDYAGGFVIPSVGKGQYRYQGIAQNLPPSTWIFLPLVGDMSGTAGIGEFSTFQLE